MDEPDSFTRILRMFMAHAQRYPSDLERLTGLSARTIEKWCEGSVRRPRSASDVLKVARALGLEHSEAETLLRAAGHLPLVTLYVQAQRANDSALMELLAPWHPLNPAPTTSSGREQLVTPAPSRHQLRAPVPDFAGREVALTVLLTALRANAGRMDVATIIGVRGMGGVGKTELAYLVANRMVAAFRDAQIVVNLRGRSTTPLPAAQAVQQVIHAFEPDTPLSDDLDALKARYRSLLHGQHVLILADDAYDAHQVQLLLPPPGCALIVTSRQRFTLPGMVTVDLEQLPEQEAVAILQSACPRLSASERKAIAHACGYLPLALRVSGSLLHNDPALSVTDYLNLLADEQQRLMQLRDPGDGMLDVAASLELSYAQLEASTQQVFRQLGVIGADFTTSLAQAVVEPKEGMDVAATLHVLLRHNLVMYDSRHNRWRLHDLVRDMARRALEQAQEGTATRWRYARAALQIMQAIEKQYRTGKSDLLEVLAHFDTERPHIDASHSWAITHAGTPEGDQLLAMAAATTCYLGELRYDARLTRLPLWEGALAAARRLQDQHTEQLAMNELGLVYWSIGAPRRAIPYYEQTQIIAQARDDLRGEGVVLSNLASAYMALGEVWRAIPFYEQTLAIVRTIGNWRSESIALSNLGHVYTQLGDAQRAIAYLEQALTIVHTFGDRRIEGYTLANLGNAYAHLGDTQRAIPYLEQALAIARTFNDQWGEAYALSYLAFAQMQQGCLAHAHNTWEQAVALFAITGDHAGEAECQLLIGTAFARHGDREHAVPLLRAAVAYVQDIGHVQAGTYATVLARLEAEVDLQAEAPHIECVQTL